MSSLLDELDADFGIAPITPEEEFYNRLVKNESIYNLQHWVKCQLHVFVTAFQKQWLVSKPYKDRRMQVSMPELMRFLLQYYLEMAYLVHFESERGRQMGKLLSMEKTIDVLMDHVTIKKLLEDPRALI